MTKPTICVIHGACIGGAMELALACDLRVIASDALIGMPEVRIGLSRTSAAPRGCRRWWASAAPRS